MKDHQVKHYLYQAIDITVFEQILDRSSSKVVWDSLKAKFGGNEKVKKSMLQTLTRDFEVLQMTNIDELQSTLVVHEQKFSRLHNDEEHVLKVEDRSSNRGRGRGTGRGRGRGRQSYNRDIVECFKCHKLGHFYYECPKLNKEANYAELHEDEQRRF
ncbi:unnamed protein product [Rhodiola kirilowii]